MAAAIKLDNEEGTTAFLGKHPAVFEGRLNEKP